MTGPTQSFNFNVDELSPKDIEDIERKRKSKRKRGNEPIPEKKPFTFNGIPTY